MRIPALKALSIAFKVFPGNTKRLHWSFEDPATVSGDDAARLTVFRRVRDEIKDRLLAFLVLTTSNSD